MSGQPFEFEYSLPLQRLAEGGDGLRLVARSRVYEGDILDLSIGTSTDDPNAALDAYEAHGAIHADLGGDHRVLLEPRAGLSGFALRRAVNPVRALVRSAFPRTHVFDMSGTGNEVTIAASHDLYPLAVEGHSFVQAPVVLAAAGARVAFEALHGRPYVARFTINGGGLPQPIDRQ